MLRSIDISTSGLVAQRAQMNTIAGNVANALTTVDADGKPSPYQRRIVTFAPTETKDTEAGAEVEYRVEIDAALKPREVYDPSHPHADANGIVRYPGIDTFTEFTNMMYATRAYEANIAAIDMARDLAEMSIRILG